MSTAANFVDKVRQSQLVDNQALDIAVAQITPKSSSNPNKEPNAAEIAQHLIRSGLITAWQAEKLLTVALTCSERHESMTTKPTPRRRTNTMGYWLLGGLLFLLIIAIVALILAFRNIQSG